MDKITSHRQEAISFIIPYLREFDELTELVGVNGDRWQTIEDAVWYILQQLNVDTAHGFWLDLLGLKAGQPRDVLTMPNNIFTFVSSVAESIARTTSDNGSNGFSSTANSSTGGLLLSKISSSGGTFISLDDEIYRKYILCKMILNNLGKGKNGIRQEIIDAIKLLTGINNILIEKTGTLEGTITINGFIHPQYHYSMKELMQTLMPQCVNITNFYCEDYLGNLVEM